MRVVIQGGRFKILLAWTNFRFCILYFWISKKKDGDLDNFRRSSGIKFWILYFAKIGPSENMSRGVLGLSDIYKISIKIYLKYTI
jgi:hypothetical protein